MSLLDYGVVTGAGSGIGRETAYTFAEKGSAGVIFADINEQTAKDAAEASKKFATNPEYRAIAVHVDVTDRDSVRSMIDLAVKEFGRLNFCCNCAGIPGRGAPIFELPSENFQDPVDINAKGTFFVDSEASRIMINQEELFTEGRNGKRNIGKGVIVNLSSCAGLWPLPSGGGYNASKYATIGITHTASEWPDALGPEALPANCSTACDLARKGVRVNAVCPSWTDTPMMSELFRRNTSWEATVNGLCPLGRMAKPEEVAETIHFLCTNGASYMNGAVIPIDAGFTQVKGLA